MIATADLQISSAQPDGLLELILILRMRPDASGIDLMNEMIARYDFLGPFLQRSSLSQLVFGYRGTAEQVPAAFNSLLMTIYDSYPPLDEGDRSWITLKMPQAQSQREAQAQRQQQAQANTEPQITDLMSAMSITEADDVDSVTRAMRNIHLNGQSGGGVFYRLP